MPTTRNSEVNWLSLNMYSGDAGEYTLTMTLQPNLTGQDRVAEIIITCADTVIRIRVEQKGTKADGEKPEGSEKRFVDNIIYKWEDSKDDWRQEITEFTYNPDGTLKLISMKMASLMTRNVTRLWNGKQNSDTIQQTRKYTLKILNMKRKLEQKILKQEN